MGLDVIEDARPERRARQPVPRLVHSRAAGAIAGFMLGGILGAVVVTAFDRESLPRAPNTSSGVDVASVGIVADNGFAEFAMTFVNYGPGPARLKWVDVNGVTSRESHGLLPPRSTQTIRPGLQCGNPGPGGTPQVTVAYAVNGQALQQFGHLVTSSQWHLICPAQTISIPSEP